MSSADVLQSGALGLLLVVLLAGITIAKNIFERMFDQNDEAFKFVREQIETANEKQSGQLEVWVDTIKDVTRAAVVTAEALGRITESLNHIGAQHVEVLACLRKLNGKEVK